MKKIEQDSNLVKRVSRALDEIRPFLKRDGGDIELTSVEGCTVHVKLLGNCSSCHINNYTLKLGVENVIKRHAPEITEIINIEI